MKTKAKNHPRIGIDLGGTKIAAIALGAANETLLQKRIPTPHNDYDATLQAIKRMVVELEEGIGPAATVGIGIPGSINPETNSVQNANSTWLNGKSFHKDIAYCLSRPIRIQNDANCFTLSEAVDGAAAKAETVFGVILGTGCGGAFIANKKLNTGPLAIGGEWGHNPLPWPSPYELTTPPCWCGRQGCIETWVSGPAVTADHLRATGHHLDCAEIARRAERGDAQAVQSMHNHLQRLARGLAMVVNLLDPHMIVLGGGLSNLHHLYDDLPRQMRPYIFSDTPKVSIHPPKFGDASGARGAAWLWDTHKFH